MPLKLDLHQVSQRFSDEGEALFHSFTATVFGGSKIACIGASGQGKSSLLKIIARLELPASGLLSYNDTQSSDIPVTSWRKNIHYVAQHATMLPGTIEDNLVLPSQLHERPFQKSYAEQLLAYIGLEQLDWSVDASTLSGGEQQRVALVRSLLLEPQVLLLDEVTASLDERHSLMVEELLRKWIDDQDDRAYIWITHQTDQAERIANEQWHFKNHRIASKQLEDVV